MEIVVKAIPSRKTGSVRFYANSPDIPSSVVTVCSYVELQAEYRIYCKMIRELGHTVDVRKPNLYSAFVHSRPEPEQFDSGVHVSEIRYWPNEESLKKDFESEKIEEQVFKLHKGDREFLKSLRIAVED